MFVFGLLAPLLGAVSSISFIAPALGGAPTLESPADRVKSLRDPAIKSFFYFVPLYLLLFAYRRIASIDGTYRLLNVYARGFFGDSFGVTALLAVGGFLTNRHLRNGTPGELFAAYTAFFAVAYTLLAGADAVSHLGVWTTWELVLLPLVRVSTIVVIPLSLTVADTVHGGGWAALLLIIHPLVAAVAPMLAGWLLPGAAVAATAALLALTGAAVWGFAFRAGA